ncbi:hypothetical protein [Azospirillum argentinense]
MDSRLLKRYRDTLLVLTYQRGGASRVGAEIEPIAKEMELDGAALEEVILLLDGQHLLDWQCPHGSLRLNSAGQHEAEQINPAIALRNLPPPPMPAINYGNINHGNQVIGGSHGIVQQGGAGASLSANGSWGAADLINVLGRIEQNVAQLGLQGGAQGSLRELVDEMRRKAQAPTVGKSVLRALGKAAVSLLTSGASDIGRSLASALTNALPASED